ncbi:MAG: metallophosphoesterase [Elusimicrobiota bacterium]
MAHAYLFVSSVILIYLCMQSYLAWWLLRNFPGLPLSRPLLGAVVVLIAVSFPLSMYWLRNSHSPLPGWFAYLSYIWLGLSLIWLTCAVSGDLLALAARLRGAAPGSRVGPAILLAGAAGLSLLALGNAAHPPRVTRLDLDLDRLPRTLEGFKIVQLSDLHLGVTVPLARFARIAGQVNALDPDLIVLTGDLLDPGRLDAAQAAAIGRSLKARAGKFGVLGNHEFYHGIAAAADCYASCGARLLRNEVAVLPEGLQIAGFDDLQAGRVGRAAIDEVLGRLDPDRPSLVLSHQPGIGDAAAAHGVGLVLSGHTHAGQIFPFTLAVRAVHKYFHGLYRLGRTTLYVTSGTGQWGPPMRLFTRSEIVLITLHSPR